ncbi:MAG TPA: hypothetical protein VNH80_13945, partial [Burkholderiales bacterium]|nr:hypothetical protein [Burkholderiales bacterium]
AKLAAVRTGPYLQRLNNPSAWSRKMMPYHRNMVRSLCRVRASFGRGMPRALASIRISPVPRRAAALGRWLSTQALPKLPERKGLTGAHLLASQPMAVAPLTVEQRIRGRDAAADWVVLVSGYDSDSVQAAAATDLAAEVLAAHGAAVSAVSATYSIAYVLTARDLAR